MISFIIKDIAQLVKKIGSRDAKDLAKYFDIRIREDNLGSLKGYILFQSRIATLCLNTELAEVYRATVICHEIGHYRYHQKLAKAFSESILFSQEKSEYEANLFAAEFLLSDSCVLDCLRQMDMFAVAATLGVPVGLLSFKLKLLQHKGYKLSNCLQISSDFLKA